LTLEDKIAAACERCSLNAQRFAVLVVHAAPSEPGKDALAFILGVDLAELERLRVEVSRALRAHNLAGELERLLVGDNLAGKLERIIGGR
jgi:hypothetical protein